MIRAWILSLFALALLLGPAAAQDSARMKQLRLLCAQLSGDLTEPGGIAAFRRCLTTHDPLGEIKRDNNIGGRVAQTPPDRPKAKPPAGFGHDSRALAAEGIHGFATGDGKLFYGIDTSGDLWRWEVATKKAVTIDHKAALVRLADAGHVLVLDRGGTLWREGGDGAGRVAVAHDLAAFQSAAADVLYGLNRAGQLWRERAGSNRVLVDSQVKSFLAVDAAVVYVLGRDGDLWRETGDALNRNRVAQHIAGFDYVPVGNTVYVIGADNSLWRQEGNAAAIRIDRDVAAFQAIDAHFAYVLGRDGRLWRNSGDRDRAVLVDGPLPVAAGRAAFQAIDAQHVVVLGTDYKLWNETMPPGR